MLRDISGNEGDETRMSIGEWCQQGREYPRRVERLKALDLYNEELLLVRELFIILIVVEVLEENE